jgi:hypothetical protein
MIGLRAPETWMKVAIVEVTYLHHEANDQQRNAMIQRIFHDDMEAVNCPPTT